MSKLLHPLGEKSPIAGFLNKNKSGGIHHVCIEVSILFVSYNRDDLALPTDKEKYPPLYNLFLLISWDPCVSGPQSIIVI